MFKKTILATTAAMALTAFAAPAYAGEDHKTRTQLINIGAYAAWERGFTGKDVIVAVLDTGLDPNHVDIKGKVVGAYNFARNSTVMTETRNGHGTAMSSIILGNYNNDGTVGVAYDAKLLFAQVGTGTSVDIRAAQRAALWAANNGAQVANMSFTATFDKTYISMVKASTVENGVYLVQDPTRNTGRAAYYGYVNEIAGFKAATDKGLILVMAAGNQGLPYAGAPGMLATATDSNGNLLLGGRTIIVGGVTSSLTPQGGLNRAGHICNQVGAGGQCLDAYRVKEFFVVAPGTTTAAAALTGNGTQIIGGTSIATAYVSGVVAVLRQAWPQLRPEQTVQLVFRTAKDLGAPGVDEVYGWGLVDLDKATRPFGNLVANVGTKGPMPLKNNTVVAGPLTAGTTSFVNASQFEDEFGRNFVVPLGMAFTQRPNSFQHPYLGLNSGAITLTVEHNNTSMKLAQDGLAVGFKTNVADVEIGYSHQDEQVLGTVMRGNLGVRNSSNAWVGLSKTVPVTDRIELGAAVYGAVAHVNNSSESMYKFDRVLVSTSASATAAYKGLFIDSDKLAVTVRPVNQVVSGDVAVTRVSDYSYTLASTGDYYTASPNVETQKFGLGKFQETQYTVGYTFSPTKQSAVTVNYNFANNASSTVSVNGVIRF